MIEHFKGEEAFVAKVKKYYHLVTVNQQVVTTPFLNPYQIKIVKSLFGKNEDVNMCCSGGIVGSESQRMVLMPSFYKLEQADFSIVVLKISYSNKFDTLRHKDVLGTFMSLGLSRDKFGDIVPGDSCYYVAIDCSVVDMVTISIEKMKRVKVRISVYKGIVERVQEYTNKTIISSSMRLDKVVASMYGMSRSKAVDVVRGGLVKVNYKVVEEIDFLCNNEDILSIRGYGRVLIKDTQRKTKSDNFVIEGFYYK